MGVLVLQGDVREVYRQLKDHSIDCVITSPPYYRQRDYGVAGQIGQESSPEEYAKEIANVFRLLWDKLKTTATVFLNIGYKYENEEFLLIPELVAWEMRKVGYVLKNKIIWYKLNSGSEGKAGVFQNKSKKYEKAKLLTSSPSGRLAVSGEKLIIKRKWLFPQGLIADYLRKKLREKGISVKKLGEIMGCPHTVGHWLRKDFSHWGKGGSIPRPEDWLKLKEILGLDDTYDSLILDRVAMLYTVKSHPEGKNIGDVW